MARPDITHWFALRMVDGIGPVSFSTLLNAFGSPRRVFDAPKEKILSVMGITEKIAANIKGFNGWKRAEKETMLLEKSDAEVITLIDEEYPRNLLNIYDAPPFLFVRGKLQPDEVCLAVVGSRVASEYGLHITHKLAFELAQKGITVTSGLARGIDAAAHRGAIAGRGRTIAVLGCGIDVIYPLENKALFNKIPERGGAIISEYFFGTPPNKENFPLRNRIISGISVGVLVVEATDKSGSLITTNIAIEQGREVFAVPGPIDSKGSRGTHLLLKSGAKLVESVDDIMEEIAPQIDVGRLRSATTSPLLPKNGKTPQPAAPRANDAAKVPSATAKGTAMRTQKIEPHEKQFLTIISKGKISLDEIVREIKIPAKDALSALSLLEIKGLIRQLPGKFFIIEELND